MTSPWEHSSVAGIILFPVGLARGGSEWVEVVGSVVGQDLALSELIIAPVDPAGERLNASELLGRFTDHPLIRRPVRAHPNRAEALAAAFAEVSSDYVALVISDAAPVLLRRSAIRTLMMAAVRRPDVGLVYGDYATVDTDGAEFVRHILDYHPGRLRETFDMSLLWLLPSKTVRSVGGIDPADGAGDLYSLRLRISEQAELVHVGSRHDGVLPTVRAAGRGHDVFDYLLDDKAAQADYERCLTAHLDRIGARLESDRPVESVRYSVEEEAGFAGCMASVVIPVYRRPEFIGTAIESALGQTVRNIEVIVVVNGGEHDPTTEQVQRYLPGGDRHDPAAPAVRLAVVDVNNIGFCLNHGIGLARGKYYVQLDSDDRLKPDAVESLVEVFESDPSVAVVIGSYEVWELDAAGTRTLRADLPAVSHPEWTAENGINNLLRVGGAGAPRSAHIKAIREVGWFSLNDLPSSRNYGEDYDLILRLGERYRIGRVWRPIYEVIRHPGGTDHSIDQVTIDRNENAKDEMRLAAIRRRQSLNRSAGAHRP